MVVDRRVLILRQATRPARLAYWQPAKMILGETIMSTSEQPGAQALFEKSARTFFRAA